MSETAATNQTSPAGSFPAIGRSTVVRLAALALLPIIWGALSPNPLLTPAAIICAIVSISLVWRRGEPSALAFAVFVHWLQASAAIFYTNFKGASLLAAFSGPELEWATWLSLGGVLALAGGCRLGLLRFRGSAAGAIIAEAENTNVARVFTAYFVAFLTSVAFAQLATRIPSISQALLFAGTIKWVLLYVLAVAVLEQKRGYALVVLATSLELAVGLLGFFAAFKQVFFVLVIAVFTSARAFRGTRLAWGIAVSVAIVLSGSVWTAVKADYRDFLNQGFHSQEVLVPVQERVGKLQDLIADFRVAQFGEGFETLILRVSYVQYFALTMVNVPEAVPYERGNLWLEALQHVVTPRVLFPNKRAIDDSERTSQYTGMVVAGAEQGTSIGIGYFGESYIDFGPVFMFVPIFVIGVLYGLLHRAFILHAKHKLFGSAIVTSVIVFSGSLIETSNIKVIGGGLTMLFVLTGFYFVAAGLLARWFRMG